MKVATELVAAANAMLTATASYLSNQSPEFQIARAALLAAVDKHSQHKATRAEINHARAIYASDEIEVDDDAQTSPTGADGDYGTWVSAWVYLNYNREV